MEDFFIKEDLKQIKIKDKEFSYKPVTAGDELDWANEYLEKKVKLINGKEYEVMEQNFSKLSICKLRNIIKVPFTKEELKSLTNLEKDFKDYTNSEKDNLFRKLNPNIYNQLIKEIDKINANQKKD